MSSEYYDALKVAREEAEKSSGGSTRSIATRYWPHIKPNGSLDPCPSCQKKSKCSVFSKGEVELIKCHYTSCELNKTRGAIELIRWHENLTYPQACDALCEYAGVSIPQKEDFNTYKKEGSKNLETTVESEPKIEETTDQSEVINIPEELNPYEYVWQQLNLTTEHRVSLQANSGFDDRTIRNYGFKSSIPENAEILKDIEQHFSTETLLDAGIYLINKKQEPYLNQQLCGKGLLPKKDQTDTHKIGDTNPILIPYINTDGRITSLRPHKTGLSNKRYIESINPKFVEEILYYKGNSHPYNALHGEFDHDWCVLTEGEKKAVALSQVGIPAVALPGIYMIKNKSCRTELVTMLRKHHIKNIVVVYDKEDKTHRPNPDDHYKTEAYAQITCHFLQKEMFYTKYNDLPEEWMQNGKVDWDSRLAEIKIHSRTQESCNKKTFKEFFSVIKQAKPYSSHQKEIFYESEKERLIRTLVTKHTYTPNILQGGEDELKLAKTIAKCSPDYIDELDAWTIRHNLLECYNCYYTLKPHNRKDAQARELIKNTKDIIDELHEQLRNRTISLSRRGELSATLALAEFRLKGNIEILSDFTMKCEYKIVGTDGKHRNLLKFTNKRGESTKGLVTPESKQITESNKFREFCQDIGSFNWLAGGRELNLLILDINTYATGKTIYEIPTIGFHKESKLYFFSDCAIKPCGKIILPDHNYVIWNDGIGYRLSPEDLAKFAMGSPPQLFQHLTLEPEEELQQIINNPKAEKKAVSEIFQQLLGDLIASFGDFQGPMILYGLIGYAAHPEMKQTPGIWVEGMMGSGKSETSHLLMRIWGYPSAHKPVILTDNSTIPSLARVLAQFSKFPVSMDEYRQDVMADKLNGMFRAAYDGSTNTKCEYDSQTAIKSVKYSTIPLVSGEGSSQDAATKSRFISAQMSEQTMKGTPEERIQRYHRMISDSDQYHRIIRYIMMHREEFSRICLQEIASFSENSEVTSAIHSARSRHTYSLAYAVAVAICKIIVPGDEYLKAYRTWLIDFASAADQAVKKSNFINTFWENVMSLYERDYHSLKHFIHFKKAAIDENRKITIYEDSASGEGIYHIMLYRDKPMYDIYVQDRKKSQEKVSLSLSGINTELSRQPYYLGGPKVGNRSHRIKINDDSKIQVWKILVVDRMPSELKNLFIENFEQNDIGDIPF